MTEPRHRGTATTRAAEPAPAVTATPTRTAVVETVDPANQPLTWGPIWAGVLTAFGLFVIFSLLALAAGLALVEFGEPGAGIGQDVPVDLIAAIVTGLFMLIAFFAGGFVASWSARETDEGRGILNGFLTWALALVVLLVFAALGMGQFLGAAGQLFGGQFALGQALPTGVDAQQMGEAFEAAAWQSVLAIVLAMAASILGGLVGTRDEFHEKFPYYRSR
jgi:hypothetical protein